jgi:hypothetical protein
VEQQHVRLQHTSFGRLRSREGSFSIGGQEHQVEFLTSHFSLQLEKWLGVQVPVPVFWKLEFWWLSERHVDVRRTVQRLIVAQICLLLLVMGSRREGWIIGRSWVLEIGVEWTSRVVERNRAIVWELSRRYQMYLGTREWERILLKIPRRLGIDINRVALRRDCTGIWHGRRRRCQRDCTPAVTGIVGRIRDGVVFE